MKVKIILLITLASVLLVGCSFNNKDIDYFDQGKQQLEDHKYKEAMDSFSTVLDGDSTNQSAKAMYLQAMRMYKSLKFEKEGNYQSAINQLVFIAKIKNGSTTIKSEAAKLKKKFQKIVDEENVDKEKRKENARNAAQNDISRVEQDATNAQYGRKVRENKNKHNNSNDEQDSGDSTNSGESNSGGSSESNSGSSSGGSSETEGSNGSGAGSNSGAVNGSGSGQTGE